MSKHTADFIRSKGLEALTSELGIHVKRHQDYENLVFLKYDQIGSPMGSPVVQECRGLMLDEENDWKPVSYPFRKFFNYGQGHAPEIDWSTARVYEKLDGSLTTLYWYDGRWNVASNGTPDAGGPVHQGDMTFAELFWTTWRQMGYRLPEETGQCFMFELMTPHNRVVVPHSTNRLVCIGARDVRTEQEIAVETPCARYGWECVKSYALNGWDSIVAAAAALNPMQSEGYVVCDGGFNRVKVKCPQYVALAHMKDGFSERRMLELVRANEGDEFLGYFPEYKELYDRVRDRFDRLTITLDIVYQEIKGIESQKDFAMRATKLPMSGALFAVRSGKSPSIRDYLATVQLPVIERALESL